MIFHFYSNFSFQLPPAVLPVIPIAPGEDLSLQISLTVDAFKFYPYTNICL